MNMTKPNLADLQGNNKTLITVSLMLLAAIVFSLLPQFAFAADPFASGKAEIKEATGNGSTVQYVIYVIALLIGAITGITQKNWFLGIGGFVATIVFWNVGQTVLTGLGA